MPRALQMFIDGARVAILLIACGVEGDNLVARNFNNANAVYQIVDVLSKLHMNASKLCG